MFSNQSIKLNLENNLLDINEEVFLDSIIDLEVDIPVLISNNPKFNLYKNIIKDYKWVSIKKYLISKI